MADELKKIEAYNTLISELTSFKTSLLESAENLSTYARTCEDIMASDTPSKRAAAQVADAVSKYRNITLEVTQLQQALISDRDELIDIINHLEQE